MDSDNSRRYTDREVAVVLHRASQIEEAGAPGPGGGLSRADLEEIAREVGISRDAITRALDDLDRRRERGSLVFGSPRVRRAVHAVHGELNEEAMARLIRLVDERAEGAGVISEALGSVRWTSSDRFQSAQVSITPEGGDTTIQVVEKSNARLKAILHGVPAGWGFIAAAGVAGSATLPVAVVALGFVVGAGVGAGAGRLAWNWISARSAKRVERLAEELAREAEDAAKQGLTLAAGEPEPEDETGSGG